MPMLKELHCSPGYMPMLKELHCSLQQTNPGVELIVLGAPGDLPGSVVSQINALTNTRYQAVQEIGFKNSLNERFALNWIKLQAWEMIDFNALIMLDTDMVVLEDLTHLFTLPTDFAWTTHQGPAWPHNSGGFVFLRPCKAVFEHMVHLIRTKPELRFEKKHAEQSFFNWYFDYTGIRLPMIYNANFHFISKQGGNIVFKGPGTKPLVIHFADIKVFTPTKGTREWEYLCDAPKHPVPSPAVTFYDHCSNSGKVWGQYATLAPDKASGVAVAAAPQLKEYRLHKRISFIDQHTKQTMVQLFDDPQCQGEPFMSLSDQKTCLNGTEATNRAQCIKVTALNGSSKGPKAVANNSPVSQPLTASNNPLPHSDSSSIKPSQSGSSSSSSSSSSTSRKQQPEPGGSTQAAKPSSNSSSGPGVSLQGH
eukprot:jgi/Chrzof1/12486/Cz06g36010.t1